MNRPNRKRKETLFIWLCRGATWLAVAVLLAEGLEAGTRGGVAEADRPLRAPIGRGRLAGFGASLDALLDAHWPTEQAPDSLLQ